MLKVALLFVTVIYASLAQARLEPLDYTPAQVQTASEIISKLTKQHYRKLNIDDQLSVNLFENYLDNLDPLKSYFLKADVDEFSKGKSTFDDALLNSDLKPGFAIFNRFRTRMADRLAANIELLQSGYEFDYEINEMLLLDGDVRDWAESPEVANDYWRKRVKDALLRLIMSDKEPVAAREVLIKRYQNQLNQLEKQDHEDVFQYFINALTELYDPHTSYMSPRTLENFNIAMSLSLEGIGAVLQSEDEFTKVVRIVTGGPADRGKELREGDKIIGVGQGAEGDMIDVIGWRLDDVVELIRGKKDTLVRLEILANTDKSKVVEIVRDKVRLEEQAAKSELLNIGVGGNTLKLGVIKLPAFYMDFEAYRERDPSFKSSTRDVQKLLVELQAEKVQGIILDLRNNGGGSLLEATALTDLFIGPGPVVQIRHANHHISRDQLSRRQAFYDGPLVVLVNRLSASASEIFAGAIQDYGRGLIVGSASFGKGTVQVLTPLKQGQLKFTESKFYRVSGNSTQHRGVIPDIVFPSYYNHDDIGESSERYALPWDSIHAVNHNVHNQLATLLTELKIRHEQRVNGEPDWQFMLDEIKFLDDQRENKEVTLHKEKRLKLQEDYESSLLTIENKRRKALAQQPFSDYGALKEYLAGKTEEKEPIDPLLQEAGMLLMDFIDLNTRRSPPRVVGEMSQDNAIVN